MICCFAAGGNTGKVAAALATCVIRKIVPNGYAFTALCRDGKAVSWGESDCTLHFDECRLW